MSGDITCEATYYIGEEIPLDIFQQRPFRDNLSKSRQRNKGAVGREGIIEPDGPHRQGQPEHLSSNERDSDVKAYEDFAQDKMEEEALYKRTEYMSRLVTCPVGPTFEQQGRHRCLRLNRDFSLGKKTMVYR